MSAKNPLINALNRFSDVLLALGVVTIVIMMIIPSVIIGSKSRRAHVRVRG